MTPPDFPAGAYTPETDPTPARRAEMINEIEQLPTRVKELVGDLDSARLDIRYRNWSVRQIVHHLADSHMNALVRFRLALTEDNPTIKPYDETRWSELPESKAADVMLSVRLLEALHARWVLLLQSMSEADFERTYIHPEYQKTFPLAEVLGMYAHHCRHHCAQIAWVLERNPS